MKKKKGFTLIEIIICIGLITIIGVSMTIVIVKNNKKKEITLLEKYSSKFENALQVYLSNHEEITYNLENNAKAAAITLEVLKNEGLIDKNIKGINYKKNYFLLSNAKLLEDKTTDETDCDNDVVGVKIFTKWDLEEDSKGEKVIYVCPKNSSNDEKDKKIEDLERRLSILEKNASGIETLFKGSNPNNWVYFNVKTDNSGYPLQVYFPNNNNKNKWRILNYYGSQDNPTSIKLVYSQPITVNNYFSESDINSMLNYKGNKNSLYGSDEITGDNVQFLSCETEESKLCIINNDKSQLYLCNKTSSSKKGNQYIYGLKKLENNNITEIALQIREYKYNTSSMCAGLKEKFNNYNLSEIKKEYDSNINNYPENSFKRKIYNDITYKNWITNYDNYYEFITYDSVYNISQNYSKPQSEKIGTLTLSEIRATKDIGEKTWLEYYSGVGLGTGQKSIYDYLFLSAPSSSNSKNYTLKKYTTYNDSTTFIPVITLVNGVKIVDNPSCENDGSEKCPYLLEYGENKTSS